jgi:hypothetical protein
MPKETAAIPRGLLGESIDRLLREREDLEARHKHLYQEWQAAEAAVGPARQADREAYAQALRADDAKDPGQLATGLAQQTLDDARRALKAMEAAFAANQDDLTAVLANRQAEIRRILDDRAEEVRRKAIIHLEAASKGLVAFAGLESLKAWTEDPITKSGDSLRPFVSQPTRVDARGRNGEPMTANAVFVLLGQRLEQGSQDARNLRAAREAGVPADRIERIEGRALVHRGKIQVQDVSKIGLTRYRVDRGGEAVDLVVAISSLEQTTLADLFKDNRVQIDAAFDNSQPVVFGDDVAEAMVNNVADEKSQSRQLRVRELDEVRADREQPTHPASELDAVAVTA